jgi:hypothetical protein
MHMWSTPIFWCSPSLHSIKAGVSSCAVQPNGNKVKLWCASLVHSKFIGVHKSVLQVFWSGHMYTPSLLEWTCGHSKIFGVANFPLQFGVHVVCHWSALRLTLSHPKFSFSFWVELQMFVVSISQAPRGTGLKLRHHSAIFYSARMGSAV